MCTLPMLIILVSVCFPFSRVSTWHQPAKTVEEESIQTDKWQGTSGDSAAFLVRSLHFIFQIINVNVIRTQSIYHFNVFANSAEPTRLSLGQTLRAHDAARSNEDGLSQTRCSSLPVLVHIRARTSQLWLLLSLPDSPTVTSLTSRVSETRGLKSIIAPPAVIRHRRAQPACQPPWRRLNWGSWWGLMRLVLIKLASLLFR